MCMEKHKSFSELRKCMECLVTNLCILLARKVKLFSQEKNRQLEKVYQQLPEQADVVGSTFSTSPPSLCSATFNFRYGLD